METLMIYPVASLILLTAIITIRSALLNVAAVRGRKVRISQFRVFETGGLPDRIMWSARNVSNLFEYPVAYYVLAVFLCLFQRVNAFYLVAAWVYVALRYAHSYVHVTKNDVLVRYRLFAAGCTVLWVMWIVFVVQTVIDPAGTGI